MRTLPSSTLAVACVALCAAVIGCSDPTPSGTVLLADSLRAEIPSAIQEALAEPTTHQGVVSLPDGGELEVQSRIATTPEGGAFISEVTVTCRDAGGWEMSASRAGNPVNRGDGTGNAARMSQGYMISRNRAGLTGTEARQERIEVAPDGTVTLL